MPVWLRVLTLDNYHGLSVRARNTTTYISTKRKQRKITSHPEERRLYEDRAEKTNKDANFRDSHRPIQMNLTDARNTFNPRASLRRLGAADPLNLTR